MPANETSEELLKQLLFQAQKQNDYLFAQLQTLRESQKDLKSLVQELRQAARIAATQ